MTPSTSNGVLANPSHYRVAFIICSMNISKVVKDGKEVRVMFDRDGLKDFYYAHSIYELGDETSDLSGDRFTMWAWVNHLRHKVWWNKPMEAEFISKVSKLL